MSRILLCALVLSMIVSGANAQQVPQPPKPYDGGYGPTPKQNPISKGPQVVEAQATKKIGEFTMTENRVVYRSEIREAEKVVNGQRVRYQYVVTIPIMRKVTKYVQVDGKKTKALDMKGKAVYPATVSKMLQKKTAIVITYKSPVSALFRQVLKPNTLNIVLPPSVELPVPHPLVVPDPAVDDLPAPGKIDPGQR